MSNLNNGIIIFGGHVQAYGILRIYSENNIPCIIIDSSKINIARHSKYCKAFFKCETNSTIDLLKQFAKNNLYKNWLLVPTNDHYVKILSTNKKVLNKYFKVGVDDWEIINTFYNKKNTYPIADSLNIPIPKTFYPVGVDNIKEIQSEIIFPCIIKPAIMLDFYKHFKQKVFVCNNLNELVKNYQLAISIINKEDILIQEIIPGSSDNQYSVGLFYNKNKAINYLVANRKRQHPLDFGNATTYAETTNIPELVEYSKKLLSKVNYWGICEVEFKFDHRDNKFKFLEVNPRTWKWHLIALKAKIPFLQNLYLSVHQREVVENINFTKVCWVDPLTDVFVKAKLIFKKNPLKKDTLTIPKQQAVFNKKDILPFFFQLFYLPYNIFKR